jgi:hypothetical protein
MGRRFRGFRDPETVRTLRGIPRGAPRGVGTHPTITRPFACSDLIATPADACQEALNHLSDACGSFITRKEFAGAAQTPGQAGGASDATGAAGEGASGVEKPKEPQEVACKECGELGVNRQLWDTFTVAVQRPAHCTAPHATTG